MNRKVLFMVIPAFLAACTTVGRQPDNFAATAAHKTYPVDPYYKKVYGPIANEPYPVPAVDLTQVNPKFLRKEVDFDSKYAPGTIVIKTSEHYAYFVLPNHKAIRYGVGVAHSQGANFRGQAVVGRKAEWPSWVPTANMMRAQPARYGKMGRGLPPGITSPLGARALYLYRNGVDTRFRLHGTIEPWSIGMDMSSGCIRFLNQDIIDLYSRAPVGTRVIVMN